MGLYSVICSDCWCLVFFIFIFLFFFCFDFGNVCNCFCLFVYFIEFCVANINLTNIYVFIFCWFCFCILSIAYFCFFCLFSFFLFPFFPCLILLFVLFIGWPLSYFCYCLCDTFFFVSLFFLFDTSFFDEVLIFCVILFIINYKLLNVYLFAFYSLLTIYSVSGFVCFFWFFFFLRFVCLVSCVLFFDRGLDVTISRNWKWKGIIKPKKEFGVVCIHLFWNDCHVY